MSVLAWLLGSSLGRKVALYGLPAIGVSVFLWRVFAAGQANERAKQAEQSLKNLRTRIKTDDEISSLSRDQRRERLRRWVSDN